MTKAKTKNSNQNTNLSKINSFINSEIPEDKLPKENEPILTISNRKSQRLGLVTRENEILLVFQNKDKTGHPIETESVIIVLSKLELARICTSSMSPDELTNYLETDLKHIANLSEEELQELININNSEEIEDIETLKETIKKYKSKGVN